MDAEPLLNKRKEGDCDVIDTIRSREKFHGPHCRWIRLTFSIGLLLLGINLTILTVTLYLLRHPGLIGSSTALLSPFSQQMFVPDFGFKTYYFGDDHEDYAEIMQRDNLTAWEERFWMNVPPGNGYHRIPNPRKFGLPPSEQVANSSEHEEMFLTTLAHQLHCIGVLREALLSKTGPQTQYHVYHCLEKLRRGVICAGDTTSEGATMELSEDGRSHWSYDDWRQPHQCRNTEAMRKWMWEHRAR